jgi:hypothetical protein
VSGELFTRPPLPRDTDLYGRLRDELRQAVTDNPEVGLALFYDLPGMLTGFPELRVTHHPEAEDEYAYVALTCPYCDQDGQPVSVDWSTRWTEADELDADDAARQVVAFYYDGSGEWDALNYQCEHCGRPVTLPDGWQEVTR